MNLDPSKRPERVSTWEENTCDLGEEFLAYDREHNRVHVLNATARDILMRCDGQSSLQQLADQIAEVYEVDVAKASDDLHATIEQFAALGLIRFVD